MEPLFSYGSLRDEKVQQALFGRTLDGSADALLGYRLATITIIDQRSVSLSGKTEHLILDPSGNDDDQVQGTVFQLTNQELETADRYEDAAYKRIRVSLRSGGEAWVYVRA